MTLEQAEAWLASLINVERMPDLRRARLSLAPIQALLAELGHPERGLRILHVAGSKGKGSTALFAEALLGAAGLVVGTYTSPHLESWVERFRIAGRNVDGERLAAAVARIQPIVERRRAEPDAPSFFDVTTAAGLLLFAEADVDAAILEVGLGGRLDSTNAVTPAVTCVTSIELEHTDKLGDTLGAIAAEKAGIAKPGVPLVMGPLGDEAAQVVGARCAEVGAPLVRLGKDFGLELRDHAEGRAALRFVDGSLEVEADLTAPGRHQAVNAALALACVRRLGLIPDEALGELAPEALRGVRLPGRVEIVSRAPWIVIDGAHTAASARALAEVLRELPHRRGLFVLSISSGKDLHEICAALLPHGDRFIVTRAEAARSREPEEVAALLRSLAPDSEVEVVVAPREALRRARAECGPNDLLCATGSIYLAGIARTLLGAAAT
ncbi:MAG: bifunctional folylpolyglutamate synthase/dihydrofolate synthase [Deltaproteobacteria bacterium]|nr:bifunctional folylpolyglutamate synthase/dihydrofolate synthase [Deltaproteobacteria bacterium]